MSTTPSLQKPPYDVPSLSSCSINGTLDSASVHESTTPSTTTTPASPNLSTLRLLFAHIGAAMTLFLATTDATIVSTSLPTITSDLKASQIQYTWVGVAYMLTQTAFQPLYGRFSDLVGRKNVLYLSMTIFAIGSALCGAAQSIDWLISARALAGIGGGGIVSAVWVMTSEIVPFEKRAQWSQALSVTWSCSAIAGPLLGGLFSGRTESGPISWRWGFYINLPICLFAMIVISLSLRGVEFQRVSETTWKTLGRKFDFPGLILFMSGTSCIIIGFSFATEAGWTAPSTLCLIIIGTCVLISGGFYERRTSREPLFPSTVFSDRTTVVILIVTFLHNFAFTAGTFYLALYYQAANGSTPLESGIKSLPYSLGSSLASMPAAWFVGYWQKKAQNTSGQNWAISAGLLISTAGFGLLNLLNENSGVTPQIIFPLIAGIGIGMLFHTPYQVFTRALKPQEIATGTSAFFLTRFTGATVGLAVAGTIFYAQIATKLPPGLTFAGDSTSINYAAIKTLEPGLKVDALRTISSAVQMIWTVCAPCLGLAFLISWMLRVLPTSDTSSPVKSHTSTVQSSAEDEKV